MNNKAVTSQDYEIAIVAVPEEEDGSEVHE